MLRAVSPDLHSFSINGMEPTLVVAPGSQEESAAILGLANEAGAAVVPWGGGTQQGLGLPPERYDLALDLSRLDRLVEYEPADLTVTVEAGMALAKLQEILGARGQWLPLDPMLPRKATIGGVLATNASGPARTSFGAARDLLIGVRFALPDGDLVKAGGRVVKNVAGYDLGKLQIGALGTLGVITQASFKLAPLPPVTRHLAVRRDLHDLMSIAGGLAALRLPVTGLVLGNGREAGGWRLDVRFAGGRAAVERSEREFEALARDGALEMAEPNPGAWCRAADESVATVSVRCSVLPSQVASLCAALASAGAEVSAYPLAGVVHAAWSGPGPSAETLQALRRACVTSGGSLVIDQAPLALRREAGVWGEARGDFELMRALKAQFDPKGILNPGRFLGGI